MTLTTELLKEIHDELEKGIKRNDILPLDWAMDRIEPIVEKELNRGRLDALKEEEKYLREFQKILNNNCIYQIEDRLVSIRKEIKLIEGKI